MRDTNKNKQSKGKGCRTGQQASLGHERYKMEGGVFSIDDDPDDAAQEHGDLVRRDDSP